MNRRLVIVALLACLAFSMAVIFPPFAEAMCISPKMLLSVSTGERGTNLTVTGQYFWDRCNDERTPGQPPPPAPKGAKNIKIFLRQGKESILLATVDADASLRFSVAVTIPANAVAGGAVFVAEAPEAYPVFLSDKEWPPTSFEVIESGQR